MTVGTFQEMSPISSEPPPVLFCAGPCSPSRSWVGNPSWRGFFFMPAIAAESDVSVGLLYRYFDSKEELYLAMCEGVTQAQLNELAAHLGTIADPRARVAAAVRHFVESLEAEGWGAIVTTGWAEADVRPALRDILRRRCDQIRSFASMFLREAMARGELAPGMDIEELSLATAMLLDGVIAHHAENGDRFDADLAQRSVNAILEPVMRS